MKEFDPSLDEIVSAYVDGVATPDERALVESDPELVERVATFRRLHDAIAAPTTPADDDLRTTLIARALAQTAAPTATVHAIHRRRFSAVGPIAAAAAIIALFFGLGTWFVAAQDNSDSDMSAASAPERDAFDSKALGGSASTTPTLADAGAAGNFRTPAAQAAEAAKTAPTYLGGFADEAALRQAIIGAGNSSVNPTTTTASGRTTIAATTSAAATCPGTDAAGVSIYAAELRGRPVTIVVNGTRADVFDNATCQVTPFDLANR